MGSIRSVVPDLPERADVEIRKVAQRISAEFHCITDVEDLEQEFVLWVVAHPGRAAQWTFVDKDGADRFGWRSFRRDAAKAMATLARKDKARAMGLYEADEVRYAKSQLQETLVWVWEDPDIVASAGADEVRTSTPKDKSQGNTHLAGVSDVREAYRSVIRPGSTWESVLIGVYRDGYTQQEVAGRMGVTQQAVSKAHARALDAMLEALNGTTGWSGEGPGSRKALSNAEAIALTGRAD